MDIAPDVCEQLPPATPSMRLIFSSPQYKNTDISDEEGNKLYTISTPRGRKQVTTITKHYKGKRSKAPEDLCVIEWHRVKKTKFWFGKREVPADAFLYRRPYSWYAQRTCILAKFTEHNVARRGRYFSGPDGRTYKWKVGFRYCWVISTRPYFLGVVRVLVDGVCSHLFSTAQARNETRQSASRQVSHTEFWHQKTIASSVSRDRTRGGAHARSHHRDLHLHGEDASRC